MRETHNPAFDPTDARLPPRIRFSGLEIQHITVAVLALTIGFAYVRVEGRNPGEQTVNLLNEPLLLLSAFLAVGFGFVGHELAHKLVAQRYGHWAEFRAQFMLLGASVLLAILSPLFFAAPGAVVILGHVDQRENGIISIVGPGVNLFIALAAMPFTFVTDINAPLPTVMGTIAIVNALLAVFNLVPAGPLDGKKVWRWNKPIWLLAFAASMTTFIVLFMRLVPAA